MTADLQLTSRDIATIVEECAGIETWQPWQTHLCLHVDPQCSEYLNCVSLPVPCPASSYLKDTTDFVRKVLQLENLPPGSILVTLNVSCLYTNILHPWWGWGVYIACRRALNTRTPNNLPAHYWQRWWRRFFSQQWHAACSEIEGREIGTKWLHHLPTCLWLSYEKPTQLHRSKTPNKLTTSIAPSYSQQNDPWTWWTQVTDKLSLWQPMHIKCTLATNLKVGTTFLLLATDGGWMIAK